MTKVAWNWSSHLLKCAVNTIRKRPCGSVHDSASLGVRPGRIAAKNLWCADGIVSDPIERVESFVRLRFVGPGDSALTQWRGMDPWTNNVGNRYTALRRHSRIYKPFIECRCRGGTKLWIHKLHWSSRHIKIDSLDLLVEWTLAGIYHSHGLRSFFGNGIQKFAHHFGLICELSSREVNARTTCNSIWRTQINFKPTTSQRVTDEHNNTIMHTFCGLIACWGVN